MSVNHPALKDGAWSSNDPGQIDQGKRYPARYVSNRSFRHTSKCFLSLLLCKDRITKAKGKAPKVLSAARKSGSRLLTSPRGDTLQGVRYKTLAG